VVVIHLFQGEVEAGAQALEQESPTEMIQARQNVAKKAQLKDQEKQQTVVQDHLGVMGDVGYPEGISQIANSDTKGTHALGPNLWKSPMTE
jgi:hypothetical protein